MMTPWVVRGEWRGYRVEDRIGGALVGYVSCRGGALVGYVNRRGMPKKEQRSKLWQARDTEYQPLVVFPRLRDAAAFLWERHEGAR